MASCLQQQNKYEQAIRYFTLSLEKNPKFICSLEERARCFSYLGKEDLAEKDSENAIKTHPYIGDFCFRYLAACLADKDDFKASISLLSDGLKYSQFHRNSTMLHQRGFQYCFVSQWQDAIQDFRMAISLDPYTAEHYLALADLLFVVGSPQNVSSSSSTATQMEIDSQELLDPIEVYERCIEVCFHHRQFMTEEELSSKSPQTPTSNSELSSQPADEKSSSNETDIEESDQDSDYDEDDASDGDEKESDTDSELAGRASVHAGNVCIAYGQIERGIEFYKKGFGFSSKGQKVARNNLNNVMQFLATGDLNSVFQLQWIFEGPIPEALAQTLEIKMISNAILHQNTFMQTRQALQTNPSPTLNDHQ